MRRNLRRGGGLLAALGTAALLAGCGTASTTATTSTAKTPTTTSTTGAGAFNPSLVPTSGSSPGTTPPKKKATTKKATKATTKNAATSKSSADPAKSSAKTTSPTVASPPPSPSPASGSSGGSGSGSGGTATVTVSHTSTVYLRPDVPAGAGLPSLYRDASVSQFDAEGGNIGCRIAGGTVRCDVAHRVWTPPPKPGSCHAAWGQGLMIGSGSAFFVCARSSVLDPTGDYIRAGYDDKVGSVTCQVRSFGVTCFKSDGHGFFIGRTGYTTF